MTHEDYERLENTFAGLDAYQTFKKMFEMTDGSGHLCIPAWPYDDCEYEEKAYQLKMTWKEADVETLFREYTDLFFGIGAIAEVNGDLYEDYNEKDNEKLIAPALLNIWKTYLRPLDVDGLSFEKFYAISEKKEFGEEVSPEEETYYREYVGKQHADAAARIDGKFAQYDVIVRAQRVYKLMAYDAPKVLIDNEERYLVQAMAVNRFAAEMEESAP